MLIPGKKTEPSQFIDVRDFVAFMMNLVGGRRVASTTHWPTDLAKPVTRRGRVPARRRQQWPVVSRPTGSRSGSSLPRPMPRFKFPPPNLNLGGTDYDFPQGPSHLVTAIPWMIPEGENTYHLQDQQPQGDSRGLKFRPHGPRRWREPRLATGPRGSRCWPRTAKTNRAVADTMHDTVARGGRLKAAGRRIPSPTSAGSRRRKEAQGAGRMESAEEPSNDEPIDAKFLKTTAAAGAAVAIAPEIARAFCAGPHRARVVSASASSFLGGTGFIGPGHGALRGGARPQGHAVQTAGKEPSGPLQEQANIEERTGDRAPNPGDYASLATGEWDVVD